MEQHDPGHDLTSDVRSQALNASAPTFMRRQLSRRDILNLSLGFAVGSAAASWGLAATAQKRAQAQGRSEIPIDELMQPGPLPELVLGKEDAPITVVEYASMTCGHCANFHNKVFPTVKEKYIDTGKVRFVMREFPLDKLAVAASMLARCAGGEKTFPLISALFAKQEEWAFVRGNPVPELFKLAKQAGFTQESFDKCLTDQQLMDDIVKIRSRAADSFGVGSTPTFFINGKKMTGAPTVEEFDKAFAALQKS
jgi:protein-disulfide isomerase